MTLFSGRRLTTLRPFYRQVIVRMTSTTLMQQTYTCKPHLPKLYPGQSAGCEMFRLNTQSIIRSKNRNILSILGPTSGSLNCWLPSISLCGVGRNGASLWLLQSPACRVLPVWLSVCVAGLVAFLRGCQLYWQRYCQLQLGYEWIDGSFVGRMLFVVSFAVIAVMA